MIRANVSVDVLTKTRDLRSGIITLHRVSACCAISHLNAPESPVLLGTCLSGESPAALFLCERQTPEKVQTQFCGHPVQFMSENGLCVLVADFVLKGEGESSGVNLK